MRALSLHPGRWRRRPFVGLLAIMTDDRLAGCAAVIWTLTLGLSTLFEFPLGFAKHTNVMLGMLGIILCCDPVASEERIAREGLIFFDYLLRVATYLAFRTGAFKNPIDGIAGRSSVVPAARPGLVVGWSHISGIR